MTFCERESVYSSAGGPLHSLCARHQRADRREDRGQHGAHHLQADEHAAQQRPDARHLPGVNDRKTDDAGPQREFVRHAAAKRGKVERLAVERPVVGNEQRALRPQQQANRKQHRRQDA